MANKSMFWFFIILLVSLIIAAQWDKYPIIKQSVSAVLEPTLGVLIRINAIFGFIVIIALTSLVLTFSQKYLSDQTQLKELRKEQKLLQEEMKKYKDHPEKLLEFQKKQLEFVPKTFELTMKPILYTSIPIILLFRWFGDHFNSIFGGWWVLWYIIGSLVFSSIFRKVFDVA